LAYMATTTTNKARKNLPMKPLPTAPQRTLPSRPLTKAKPRSQTVSQEAAPTFASTRNANGTTTTKYTYTFSQPTAAVASHSTPMYTTTYYYSGGSGGSGSTAAAATTTSHPWAQTNHTTPAAPLHTNVQTTQSAKTNNNNNDNNKNTTGFTYYSTQSVPNGAAGNKITTHYTYTVGGANSQPPQQPPEQHHPRQRSQTLPSVVAKLNSYRKALPLAPATQNSEMEYAYGDHVDLNDNREGTVRFIGEIAVELNGDIWYGVELDDTRGDNNGSLKGVPYFKCADNCGTFVQKRRIRWLSSDNAQVEELDLDSPQRWHINQKVKVRNKRGKAQIRFIGLYEDELRYGVEFMDDTGTHSGHIGGKFYFTCGILRGLFVAPSDLIRIDESKEEDNNKPIHLSHALLARNGDEEDSDSDQSTESDVESVSSINTLSTVDDETFERVHLNDDETDMAFAQIFNKYKNMEAAQPSASDAQRADASLGVLQQVARDDTKFDDTKRPKSPSIDPSETTAIADSPRLGHAASLSNVYVADSVDAVDAGCTLDEDEQREPRVEHMHPETAESAESDTPPPTAPRTYSIVVSSAEPEPEPEPDSRAHTMPPIAEHKGAEAEEEDEDEEEVHDDADMYEYDAFNGNEIMQESTEQTQQNDAPLHTIQTIPSQNVLQLYHTPSSRFSGVSNSPFMLSHSPQVSLVVGEDWFELMAQETHLKAEPESPFDVNTTPKEFANVAQLIQLGCNNPQKIFKVLKGISIKLYKHDMEYRVISAQSQRVRVKLLNYDGVEEFLNKLGFESSTGDNGDKLECALDQPPACVLEAAINVCNDFISKCSRDRAVIDMIKNFGNTLQTPLSATTTTQTPAERVRGASATESQTQTPQSQSQSRARASTQPSNEAYVTSVGLPPPHDDDDDDDQEEQKSVTVLGTEPVASSISRYRTRSERNFNNTVPAESGLTAVPETVVEPADDNNIENSEPDAIHRQSSFGEQVQQIEMHHRMDVEQHEIEDAVDELFAQDNAAEETTEQSTTETTEDDELEGNDDTFQLYHIVSVITHEENIDNSARQILLLCYPTFASAEQIWDCLDRRFFECDIVDDCEDEQQPQQSSTSAAWIVQSKVTAFIKIWIKQYWDEDWHSNALLLSKLQTWLQKTDTVYAQRSDYSRYKKLIEMLSTTVAVQLNSNNRKQSLSQSQIASPTPMMMMMMMADTPSMQRTSRSGGGGSNNNRVGAKLFDTTYDFIKLKNAQIARQLTDMDMSFFCAIQPRECLGQAWKKDNKYEIACNLCNLIDHCNRVARWVQARILLAKTAKIRGRLIKKFVKICHQLFVLRNFSSLFAIHGALNSTPIIRLKKAWHYVPTKHCAKFEEFKVIFASKKNNANLRRLHRETNPPMMPYIGLYLQDLFNVEEGNQKTKQDGSVNFARLIRLSTVIDSLLWYQNTTYKIFVDKQLQLLLSTELFLNQHLDDDFLWNLSKSALQTDNKKSNFIPTFQSQRRLVF